MDFMVEVLRIRKDETVFHIRHHSQPNEIVVPYVIIRNHKEPTESITQQQLDLFIHSNVITLIILDIVFIRLSPIIALRSDFISSETATARSETQSDDKRSVCIPMFIIHEQFSVSDCILRS